MSPVEPAEKPVKSANQALEQNIHLIVFKLGTEEYGIRIEQVKEVTVTPEIARMPKTPPFIKGVANVRGDILAIMDLEERFGIKPSLVDDQARNTYSSYTLVVEAKDYVIGVVVREVPQSLTLPVSRIDRSPSFLQDLNVHQHYIEGIGKLDNRIIIMLDMNRILNQQEIEVLPEKGIA